MYKKYYFVLLMLAAFSSGCRKSDSTSGIASLNLVNATVDQSSVYVYLTETDTAFYAHYGVLNYASYLEYGVPSGDVPLTVVNTADTTQALLRTKLQFQAGGMYTLYLVGQSQKLDTIWVQEAFPVHHDTVTGLRVLNLSPDGGPISMNQSGSDQPEFTGLGYKSSTAFKEYMATPDIINNGGYNFEFKDEAGNVLATYNWYDMQAFKNQTLVICGTLVSGIQVFEINNF